MTTTPITAALPPSGLAMDRRVPVQRRMPWRLAGAVLALVGALAWAWQQRDTFPVVTGAQLATVERGEFRDELPLRARVEPLRSVQLDAADAGRVEAVFVHDGQVVSAGAPLYRLGSPEQEQLLMQRSAEVAQQMANVSVQRSAQAASLAQNRRELAQLQADAALTEAELARQQALADAGYVSAAALDQVHTRARLAAQLLDQARIDQLDDARIRQQSLDEMDRAVRGLQRGLQLLQRDREHLLQRAPMAGRLSGFELALGASVRPGDRLGRIDDPDGGVQLVADVDEFYLPRLAAGLDATSETGTWRLAQTLPQVHDGRARVLLRWPDGPPPAALRPGQTLELRLQMSTPRAALLLPDAPGVQERLYVRHDRTLERRSVRLGARAAGRVEVLSGLQAGDEVLISAVNSEAERLSLP